MLLRPGPDGPETPKRRTGITVTRVAASSLFEDLSDRVIQDDVFSRPLTFPNVFITAHQAFFTKEALQKITVTTLGNASAFASGSSSRNALVHESVRGDTGSTGAAGRAEG